MTAFMASIPGFIQDDDETVKKWIKEIVETESSLKRMQNDLEVEHAKEKLVVSEWEGEILKLEEFINLSMSNENNRLKTLMVNQLIEIDKKEVLANIYHELQKQRETFLKELPASFSKPKIQVTDIEKTQETQRSEKEDRTKTLTEGRTKTEADILRIELDIAEAEKEQIRRRQCLVQHQELLDEFKILAEFTNSNEQSWAAKLPEINIPILEDSIGKPRTHSSPSPENYDNCTLSSSRSNPRSEAFAMSMMPSEHDVMRSTSPHHENKKESCYGPYNAHGKNSAFVLKTSKRMNRVGTSSDTVKRSKLDLYDVSRTTLADPVKNDEISATMKRTTTAFKLKTPSCLQRLNK